MNKGWYIIPLRFETTLFLLDCEYIMTPKTFSIYIESQVREKNITHMDAILEYCIKNEIESFDTNNNKGYLKFNKTVVGI